MGSPNADGNPMKVVMPATEHVSNLKSVEDALIFSEIKGKRDWIELLTAVFSEEYHDPKHLQQVIKVSVERISRNYVPTKVMALYREELRLNTSYALK